MKIEKNDMVMVYDGGGTVPHCKRPAHIAKRDGDFYFVDDEYNPFVRHAPVKTMGSSTTRKTVIRRSTVTWIR